MAWLHSWILWGLVPVFLAWIWEGFVYRRRSSHGLRQKTELWGQVDFRKVRWRSRLTYISFIFLTIAAAGPQIGTRVKPVERKGVDLVFALDVSESMNAPDVKPTRLRKAKAEMSQLINHLKGDRVGIIVFAGASHLYLPLTSDYEAAKLFLDAIDTRMIRTQGTALSTAITTGINSFLKDSDKHPVLVLISDGEDHEGQAIEIARKAAESGMVIHAVGIGSEKGSLIPVVNKQGLTGEYKRDSQGKLVTSKLNESILRDIAQAGNGIYVRFDNSLANYRKLLNAIDSMEKETISTHVFSEYENRYRGFAFSSLLLLILALALPTSETIQWRRFHG
ncbi:MAG: VWA domain-containing protein [FCB group bacterium]|nr:VWA domain-containing protein [FCB group bacterium]